MMFVLTCPNYDSGTDPQMLVLLGTQWSSRPSWNGVQLISFMAQWHSSAVEWKRKLDVLGPSGKPTRHFSSYLCLFCTAHRVQLLVIFSVLFIAVRCSPATFPWTWSSLAPFICKSFFSLGDIRPTGVITSPMGLSERLIERSGLASVFLFEVLSVCYQFCAALSASSNE